MQFVVPQFIDKKQKIAGPFSFSELIFIIIVGVICIFLFFTVPFPVFITATIILGGAAVALLFVKIEGNSLPSVVKNLSVYLLNQKVYLWQKKALTLNYFQLSSEPEKKPEKEKKEVKLSQNSRLRQLITEIETKNRK